MSGLSKIIAEIQIVMKVAPVPIIDLNIIRTKPIPGITKAIAAHLYQACQVSLYLNNHSPSGTLLPVKGSKKKNYNLVWKGRVTSQTLRAWNDIDVATEHGAICIVIMLALDLTDYTVIERSKKGTGFDYWLGKPGDVLFQRKARLEVSGKAKGSENELRRLYEVKLKQTDKSDHTKLPAFAGVVEFGFPSSFFGKKK